MEVFFIAFSDDYSIEEEEDEPNDILHVFKR